MNSFLASDQLFSESSAIMNVSIDDKLLKQFSTNVRKLAKTLQDWIELSTDWDMAIGRLRRADWQLRNDPAPLNLSHPAIVDLSEGIGILEGLFKNMSSEIQQTCTSIVASGQKILEHKTSELTNILLNKLNEADGNSIGNILVVRQESIRINVSNWLMEKGINQWKVFTANQFIHSDMYCSRMLVVGLTQDYPISLFNSAYPEYGIYTFSHSWIREQEHIPGYFSDIAQVKIERRIHTDLISVNEAANIEIASNFLEPTAEIDGRRLAVAAKRALLNIKDSSEGEELLKCRAYLLGSSEMVFLPTVSGAIDAVDPNAPVGERVQRIAISSISTDSILLLRVGSSEGEAISRMANDIGGSEAKRCREIQSFWKSKLKEKTSINGAAKVIRDLKDLGVANPWIVDWSHPSTIRPNSIDNFKIILTYLNIEHGKTIEAMNTLRHLHQVAGMRFRAMLKQKFETLDLDQISVNGYVLVELGNDSEVAKLGAFKCVSIGSEVFEVPESAVKQLQPGIKV
jgi:hypothetical protein